MINGFERAASHLRQRADHMRTDSGSPIANMMANIFEGEADQIDALSQTLPVADMEMVERISRAVDPEAWDDSRWLPTRADMVSMHGRRRAANEVAARVAAALSV